MIKEDRFIDKKFRLLLGDAILLIEEAQKERNISIGFLSPDQKHHNRDSFQHRTREASFARAAIMSSVLMLEASANCCIFHLGLQNDLYTEIDRLPLMDKFEYYLQGIGCNKALDKGSKYIQGAEELIGVRNSLAHPKPYERKWKRMGNQIVSESSDETQFLKLPQSFFLCKKKYALNSFKASMSFINFFFLELCGYNYHETNNILLGGDEVESTFLQDWIRVHDEWGVDVDFLIDVQMVKDGEKRFHTHLRKGLD